MAFKSSLLLFCILALTFQALGTSSNDLNVDIVEGELTESDLNFVDFIKSVENGNIEQVKRYIEELKVDVNKPREGDKNAAIHIAVETENLELLKYLASVGANINQQNLIGDTPIHIAVKKYLVDAVKFILQLRPDLLIASDDGTPLLLAASEGKRDLVKLIKQERIRNHFENNPGA